MFNRAVLGSHRNPLSSSRAAGTSTVQHPVTVIAQGKNIAQYSCRPSSQLGSSPSFFPSFFPLQLLRQLPSIAPPLAYSCPSRRGFPVICTNPCTATHSFQLTTASPKSPPVNRRRAPNRTPEIDPSYLAYKEGLLPEIGRNVRLELSSGVSSSKTSEVNTRTSKRALSEDLLGSALKLLFFAHIYPAPTFYPPILLYLLLLLLPTIFLTFPLSPEYLITSKMSGDPPRRSGGSRGRPSVRQQPPRTSSSRGNSATSRQSRRRSSDPYPHRSQSPPLQPKLSPKPEAEEQPVASGSGTRITSEIELAEQSRPSTAAGDKVFQLIVVQQPEIGAETAMERMTLGRLPIIPAPVVQLVVRDQSGAEVDIELPYLICSCSLRAEDGVSQVVFNRPSQSGQAADEEPLSLLIGHTVRGIHRVTDLQNNPVSVFVFEDMSVGPPGKFTLEFRLGEARRPKSPRLAAVISDPFDVVAFAQYPGRPAEDILTPLSAHLASLGVPMYIPPLTSLALAVPPPPGSNPFPPDADIPDL